MDWRAFGIMAFLRGLSWLPLGVTHRMATVLGRWLVTRQRWRLVEVTRANITHCFPQLSSADRELLIKDSLVETCKTFMELGAVWLWPVAKTLALIRGVTGEEYLQAALQQGKGVILLTPHLGAWEMAGLYTSAHYHITALYRTPKLVDLDQFILTARERAGGRYVNTEQAGIRLLYQTLKQGRVIGILPDQVPKQATASIPVPFFGIVASTMMLVSRLAHKTGAPVIFIYAERLARGEGFHLHFLPAPAEIMSEDIIQSASALNRGVEQCIEACPTQYQWSYKRFKKV